MSYFDKNGLVRMQKGINTENGILFLAYWVKLKILNGGYINYTNRVKRAYYASRWSESINSPYQYQANPPERGSHFSRDNMWGMYYLSNILFNNYRGLPLMVWNGRKWYNPKNWHPNNWAVYLSLRNKFFKVTLSWLVFAMKAYSKITRDGEGDTSGALLWWLLYGDEHDNMLKDFEYYVTYGYTRDNWDNPILIQANKLWGK